MSRLPIRVTTDNLVPTLDSSMNVFESSKSYAVKKSTIKKSTAFNDEPPVTQTDSFTAISERASEKFNDHDPVKVESHQLERHHEMNGKLSDYSSQSFSFGNLDLQNKIQAGKQCSITALKPARKQTAPRFLSTIDGAIVDVGRNVHFEAIVESYPAANIVWYKNNEELSIQPGKMKITWELNRATLEIFDVDSGDAGRYTCSASNDVGNASCSADLFVKKTAFPPVMGRRLHPQSVPVGHRVTFEVEVTGTPSPTVTWFKDDMQLAKVSPFYRLREQGNSFALIMEKTRFEDSGQYKAKASNEAGEAVSIATLHIFEPPKNVTDSCQISQDSVESTFIENPTIPNKFDTNTTKLSELSSNYSSEFSKKIEVSKTNKHISFNVDGQKFEDDFSVKKNEYEYRNLGSGDGTKSVSTTEEFVHKANDQPVYENKSQSSNKYNFNPSGTSIEIEELQKPIIYSNTMNSYSSNASNLNKEIYLEPGPPPELGYIPKESVVVQKREPVSERVKKLENCTRELSPVEIPAGAVKIFPTIIPKTSKDSQNSHLQKKYSSCVKEYKNTIQRSTSTEEKSHSETTSSSTVQQSPNIKVSEMERSKSSTDYNAAPIYRPPAEVELRPLSPRPSAEGVGMEKMWTQKKQSEESSTYIRPITPYSNVSGEEKVFRVTDIKRSLSPLPSAEGVAMDKLWAHPIHLDKRNRPHSVIGGVTDNVTSDSEVSRTHVEKTWAPVGAGNAKTSYTARHIYEDVHKVNDQVVSETKFDETVTNKDGAKSIQRSISEEKKPKKFKWPPQDVRIEDSLVRKGVHRPGSPEIYGSTGIDQQYCRTEQSIHKNVEQLPQKYYQAVRSVPYPASKSVSYEKQEFCSNQTLPRSFKFASSSDSKFKPVKPYSPGSIRQRPDSDYESDFEVTKISKQAYGSESNEYSSSSTYSVNKDGARVSDKFIANKAVFSKGEPPRKTFDSGYTADTDEPIYLKGSTFVPKSTYPRVAFSSSTYQNYNEQNKTQTFPRISENKISNSFTDDTATSRRSTSFAPVPSPSKFIRSDIRESDYESDFDSRIPPIWRPSDSEPDEPAYRPVRPILQSSAPQRPQYYRTTSADAAISTKYSDTKANFKPVSPAVEYCTSVRIKPSPTFNDQSTKYQSNSSSMIKDKQFSRSYSGGGDSSALRNDVQKQSWQRGGYDGNYEESSSKAEYVDQSSFTEYHSEVKKVQKVEEIRKRFETKSSSFSGDLPVTYGDADSSLSRSRFLTDNFTTSKQFTDVNHSSQFKPQQFIDNIVNSVSSRQHELKQGAMKSPSLYSSSLVKEQEPRVFKDRYSNSERMSSNEGGWVSDISRSTEAEYVVINGGTESHAPHTIPVFTTPLHDIAAVIGSLARFECIIQTESPFNVEWRRNGEVVRDSELCQLSYRNGVCKLTLLKTYMYDAGTYQCIVTNRAGSAETSATLTVSGERRSYIKK